jgi:two-component system, chemotaxis family, sensor kinase CheA
MALSSSSSPNDNGSKKFDIRYRLAGLSFAIVGTVALGLTLHFSASHVEAARARLEQKARLDARLLSQGTQSAVAFTDKETAREVLEAAALDTDIRAVSLLDSKQNVIGEVGEAKMESSLSQALGAVGSNEETNIVCQHTSARIGCAAKVISREGPRGVIVVEMSTASIDTEMRRVVKTGLIAGAIALMVGLIASLIMGTRIGRRLRRIQSATQAFSTGKLDVAQIDDGGRDEIGRLGRDFNTMASRIRDLVGKIETDAAEEKARLDGLVAKRTAEVTRRNEDLKFLLDNVGQGFVTVGRDGSFSNERSAILERWFGPISPASKLWEYIRPHDSRAAQWIEIGWDALIDDLLPLELAVDQLPQRVETSQGKTFAVEYRPILDEEQLIAKLVVVISDITAEVGREQAEAAQKELAAVVGRFARDPAAVRDLLREGFVLMDSLRSEQKNVTIQKRVLHTLKGNTSFFGLARLSSECHRLEAAIAESGVVVSQAELETTYSLWAEVTGVFSPLLKGDRDAVSADRSELTRLSTMVATGEPRTLLVSAIDRLIQEPMEQRLARVAEQAHAVAARVGKPNVAVKVEANGVRLDAQRWSPFWTSLIHVIRNALDHGIEDESTRRACGKSDAGEIVLRTMQTLTEDVIEIADDGAGINWATLRARARALGVAVSATTSSATDVDLLFLDGVSSKTEVTEVSGRGIGLGAVRAECAALGGRVEVVSTEKRGTTFRFRFPRSESSTGAGRVIIQRSMRPAASMSIA